MVSKERSVCSKVMVPAHLDTNVRVGKAPAHVGHVAVVGAGRPDQVWIGSRPLLIPRSQDRCPQAIAIWERIQAVTYAVDGFVQWVAMVRGVWFPRIEIGFVAGKILFGKLEAVAETFEWAVPVRSCHAWGAAEAQCQHEQSGSIAGES